MIIKALFIFTLWSPFNLIAAEVKFGASNFASITASETLIVSESEQLIPLIQEVSIVNTISETMASASDSESENNNKAITSVFPSEISSVTTIEDAYINVNGQQIDGRYDFNSQQLVFLIKKKTYMQDGLQIGHVAVRLNNGQWFYKDYSFNYDGTQPNIRIIKKCQGISIPIPLPGGGDDDNHQPNPPSNPSPPSNPWPEDARFFDGATVPINPPPVINTRFGIGIGPGGIGVSFKRCYFAVSVNDPEGFTSIVISGKFIARPQPIVFSVRRYSYAFKVKFTSKKATIRVAVIRATANEVKADQTLQTLASHKPNIINLGTPTFFALQNQGYLHRIKKHPEFESCNNCLHQHLSTQQHINELIQATNDEASPPVQGVPLSLLRKIQTSLALLSSETGTSQVGAETWGQPSIPRCQAVNNSFAALIMAITQQISHLKEKKQTAVEEITTAEANAPAPIKDARIKKDKLRHNRDAALKNLKTAITTGSPVQDQCHDVYSTLPGASPQPTSNWVGSNETPNKWGGRVYIADQPSFDNSLQEFEWAETINQCTAAMEETYAAEDSFNDQYLAAQTDYDETVMVYDEAVAETNSTLPTLKEKERILGDQITVLAHAVTILQSSVHRCLRWQEQQQLRLDAQHQLIDQINHRFQAERRIKMTRAERKRRNRTRTLQLSTLANQSPFETAIAQNRLARASTKMIASLVAQAKKMDHKSWDTPIPTDLLNLAQNALKRVNIDFDHETCLSQAKLTAIRNTNSWESSIPEWHAALPSISLPQNEPLSRSILVTLAASNNIHSWFYGGIVSPITLSLKLITALGSELFAQLLSEKFTPGTLRQISDLGLNHLLKLENITLLSWNSNAHIKGMGETAARSILLFNRQTGWMALMNKTRYCPIIVTKFLVQPDQKPAVESFDTFVIK